jgi:hypothetical protein
MSNINPNNIDGTFPIAGQDNSSQGFRDNFTNIRNNFSYAQSEISDLQAKSITVSALTGATLTNNMGYNQLQYPQLFSPSYTYLNIGTPTAATTVTLDYSQAAVQKYTTNGSNTLAFANWPTSGQMGKLILWINVTNTSHVVTLPIVSPGITSGLNSIAGANAVAGTITFDQVGNYFFEFLTVDNGSNISITDLSRNYSTLRDPNFYWDDEITPTLLVGYGANQTSFQTVLALETGQDSISAKGSYNSVAVGNLTLANINSPYIDTGALGGYSVSALRGNLQTGTLTASNSNDLLGIFNGITYTGNINSYGNYQFTQVSSIGMYATGSNTIAGLGGNIALFTHAPGTVGNLMVQAVGIENDQSIKMFGNVTHNAGFVDTGYQYGGNPSSGFWANISVGKSRMIFDPASTVAAGGVTLPNCTVDGTIVSIHSTATITTLTANSLQVGTTVKPSSSFTLTAGTGVDYFYHANENTWYKIR